jgi:hypothetical protein
MMQKKDHGGKRHCLRYYLNITRDTEEIHEAKVLKKVSTLRIEHENSGLLCLMLNIVRDL